MSRAFKVLLVVGALVVLIPIGFYVWARSNPSLALDLALEAERASAGLHSKQIDAAGTTWPYLDSVAAGETANPDAPVLVLLHGFGADSDNWLRFAQHIDAGYRIIAPDLPGFGAHAPNPDWTYDIASQAERLDQFLSALELDAVHLAGNSMGGNLTASYALAYPQRVLTLGLFCPAGVPEPQDSLLTQKIKGGENLLVPRNRKQYDALMELVFVEPIELPGFLATEIANRAVAQADFRERAFREYRGKFVNLEPLLPQIEQPALVFWGAEDGLIHASSADVWDRQLPQSTKVVLENVGHAPMLEVPQRSATIYQAFLKDAGVSPAR